MNARAPVTVRTWHAMDNRIHEALKLALKYGHLEGAPRKMWVIDQMVRVLAGDEYKEVIGILTTKWDEGTPP